MVRRARRASVPSSDGIADRRGPVDGEGRARKRPVVRSAHRPLWIQLCARAEPGACSNAEISRRRTTQKRQATPMPMMHADRRWYETRGRRGKASMHRIIRVVASAEVARGREGRRDRAKSRGTKEGRGSARPKLARRQADRVESWRVADRLESSRRWHVLMSRSAGRIHGVKTLKCPRSVAANRWLPERALDRQSTF